MQKWLCSTYEGLFIMLCSSLPFYVLLYSLRLLAHIYIFFIHCLTTNYLIPVSCFIKLSYFLLPLPCVRYCHFCLILCLFFIISATFIYKQNFFLPVCSEIIIAVRWHYHQSPCHYQSIITLSSVSVSLSEYRHIIRIIHATIRVSSHHQSPCHYQSIITLSSVSMPLS